MWIERKERKAKAMGPGLGLALVGALLLPAAPGMAAQSGVLQFYANGEELIVEGFMAPQLSKDGWSLSFEEVWVNLANITAYQSDPPYDPRRDGAIVAQ